MKLLHFALSALLFLVHSIPTAGQSIILDECTVLSSASYGRSGLSFQRAQANDETRFDSLKDLEPDVAANISLRLRKHLGDELGGRIKLSWGHFYKDPTDHSTYYRLQLTLTDKTNGLASYGFEALAGDFGENVKVFSMPNLTEQPEKGTIIPCSVIAKIADQIGMPKGKRIITFDYDPISDSLVWILFDDVRKPLRDESSIGPTKINNIFIQAHTGKIIRVVETSYSSY